MNVSGADKTTEYGRRGHHYHTKSPQSSINFGASIRTLGTPLIYTYVYIVYSLYSITNQIATSSRSLFLRMFRIYPPSLGVRVKSIISQSCECVFVLGAVHLSPIRSHQESHSHNQTQTHTQTRAIYVCHCAQLLTTFALYTNWPYAISLGRRANTYTATQTASPSNQHIYSVRTKVPTYIIYLMC